MMRIDQRMLGFTLSGLVLATVVGGIACSQSQGTKEWPDVYPAEEDIDRPKGVVKPPPPRDAGIDAGDASTEGDAALDAGNDAASDASASGDAALDANVADAAADASAGDADAGVLSDGGAEAG